MQRALLAILLLATGCQGHISKQLPTAISRQLDLTPVVPLGQNVRVGDVYCFAKDPTKDRLATRMLAFSIPIDVVPPSVPVEFPQAEFSVSGMVGGTVQPPAIAMGEVTVDRTKRVTLSVGKAEKSSVASASITGRLISVDSSADGGLARNMLAPEFRDLVVANCSFAGDGYARNVAFLRTTTETYSAKSFNFEGTQITSAEATGEGQIGPALVKAGGTAQGKSSSKVVLVGEFEEPMVFGLDGNTYAVWLTDTGSKTRFQIDQWQ